MTARQHSDDMKRVVNEMLSALTVAHIRFRNEFLPRLSTAIASHISVPTRYVYAL